MKKKIIILTAFFIVFHLLFLRLYDKLLHSKDHKNSYLVSAMDGYREMKTPLHILFLGDSHIERGVDLTKIPDSYSIAYFGENNMMGYYKFQYCMEQGYQKPEYLVIDSDIMTYAKGFNYFITQKGYYYSLMSFDDLKDLNPNPLNTYYDYIKLRIFPYAEWQTVLKQPLKKGKEKIYITPKDKAYHASYFIQKELLLGGKKENFFYPRALSFLEKTILLCRQYNVKPVFVRFPVTRQLLNEVRDHVDSTFLTERPSEKIIRSYNVPILDYEKLLQDRSDYFYDSHHLNEAGRGAFTRELKKGLDSLTKVY